jgi:hypothetical protein
MECSGEHASAVVCPEAEWWVYVCVLRIDVLFVYFVDLG